MQPCKDNCFSECSRIREDLDDLRVTVQTQRPKCRTYWCMHIHMYMHQHNIIIVQYMNKIITSTVHIHLNIRRCRL